MPTKKKAPASHFSEGEPSSRLFTNEKREESVSRRLGYGLLLFRSSRRWTLIEPSVCRCSPTRGVSELHAVAISRVEVFLQVLLSGFNDDPDCLPVWDREHVIEHRDPVSSIHASHR
jgi:hypothetical protein